MNKFLENFLKIGLAVAKTQVPAIATVEEAIKEAKAGGSKKAAVLKITMASPEIVEAIAGKEILDEKLLAEGIAEVNDGYVKIMNSLKKENE